MKGTLVTSLALVAVTTGPDMIKMLRGRISGTQFIRNLAVASSGVAGGAVGSVAGGILFSPLGPFGALTGRVVGGVLGGMIASAVSGKLPERWLKKIASNSGNDSGAGDMACRQFPADRT